MNVEDVKARTVYIVAEIFNDGFVFERLGTCPPEHEHLTPSEAALCGHNNPAWGGVDLVAVDGESREARPLTAEEPEEIRKFWESHSQQKTVS
jgi:hypothetical protein